jgi:hypothetical protein
MKQGELEGYGKENEEGTSWIRGVEKEIKQEGKRSVSRSMQ